MAATPAPRFPDFSVVPGFLPYIPKGFSDKAFTSEQWRILFTIDKKMNGETMHALCAAVSHLSNFWLSSLL